MKSLKLDFDGAHINWLRYLYELFGPALASLPNLETLTIRNFDVFDNRNFVVLGEITFPRLASYWGPAFLLHSPAKSPALKHARVYGHWDDYIAILQNIHSQNLDILESFGFGLQNDGAFRGIDWFVQLQVLAKYLTSVRDVWIYGTPGATLINVRQRIGSVTLN